MSVFDDAVTLGTWAIKGGPVLYDAFRKLVVEVPGLDLAAVERAIKPVSTSAADAAVDAEIERLDK